jgi:hypothetical protein
VPRDHEREPGSKLAVQGDAGGGVAFDPQGGGAEGGDQGMGEVCAAEQAGELEGQHQAGHRAHDHDVELSVIRLGLGGDGDAATVARTVGEGGEHDLAVEWGAVSLDLKRERPERSQRPHEGEEVGGHAAQPAAAVGLVGDLSVEADAGRVEEGVLVGAPQVERLGLPRQQQARGGGGRARDTEGASEVVAGAGGDDPQGGAGAGEAGADVTDGAVPADRADTLEACGGSRGGEIAGLVRALSELDLDPGSGAGEGGAGGLGGRTAPTSAGGRIGDQADVRGYGLGPPGPIPGTPGPPGRLGPLDCAMV